MIRTVHVVEGLTVTVQTHAGQTTAYIRRGDILIQASEGTPARIVRPIEEARNHTHPKYAQIAKAAIQLHRTSIGA
jgi:hypothetical protein